MVCIDNGERKCRQGQEQRGNMADSDNGEKHGRQEQQRETWQTVTMIRNMVDNDTEKNTAVDRDNGLKYYVEGNGKKHPRQ